MSVRTFMIAAPASIITMIWYKENEVPWQAEKARIVRAQSERQQLDQCNLAKRTRDHFSHRLTHI